VRVRDLLEDLLERLEPAGQQVAILEQHPVTLLRAPLEHRLRDGALALAERHVLHLGATHPALDRELEEVGGRVGAGREDEDDRHHRRRVLEDDVKVEHGRRDEVLAHLADDELGDGDEDAVDAEAAQEHHLLHQVQLLVVAARVLDRLGRIEIVPRPPLLDVCLHVGGQVLEVVAHLDETLHVVPARVGDEISGRRVLALFEREVALEEEVELRRVERAVARHDAQRHLEREHELVDLEDRAARVVVAHLRERQDDVLEPVLKHRVLLGTLERLQEDDHVERERELVHVVEGRERAHDEEEDRAALGHGPVGGARDRNLLRGHLRLGELGRDLGGLGLGLLERRDQVGVV